MQHLKNASFAGFGLKFPLSLHATIIPNFTNFAFFGVSRQSNALNLTALDWTQLSKKECLKYGGSLVGKSCKFVPDLALMSFILFFGTYSMTLTLKKFKFSRYFPTKVRKEPNSARSFPRNEGKRELPGLGGVKELQEQKSRFLGGFGHDWGPPQGFRP